MDTSAAPRWPTERLTWDEIRARYPDEWVALVDVDVIDDASFIFRTAVVLVHGANGRELIRRAELLLPEVSSCAYLYTGVHPIVRQWAKYGVPR